ncbi:CAP domain-containing protein [Haladaptatus cibarius]|uniref:CAP domain-containing protein n=1 Tax=Haladaptatus cibarius TaxID=453847 RepID=UPI0006791BDB|nr:CAP domain-containing protein [Haladaptatus cibarius]
MRSLVPPILVFAALLFFGAYFVGYPVPGGDTLDSFQGAEVIEVPEDNPEAVTEPTDPEFRRWAEFYIHRYVNEERTDHGLEPVEFDTALRDIARNHSEEMGRESYFSHVSPSGESPSDRYREADYHCLRGAGENIAYTYFDRRVRTENGTVVRYRTADELARGVVTQWMNSPSHRENMLSENWEREGIGVYYADSERVFATQNFC